MDERAGSEQSDLEWLLGLLKGIDLGERNKQRLKDLGERNKQRLKDLGVHLLRFSIAVSAATIAIGILFAVFVSPYFVEIAIGWAILAFAFALWQITS